MTRIEYFLALLSLCIIDLSMASGFSSSPETLSERKWNGLAKHCVGSWSGTIGFYKCKVQEDADAEKLVIPDDCNNSRNVRMSAQPRASDPDIIDWVVWNVRKNGESRPVVINRDDSKNPSPKRATGCFFEDGIITRHLKGNFFQRAAIENGFWDTDEKMRRTVVIEYDDIGILSSICYMQQAKKPDEGFDVTAVNLDHVSDMPKEGPSLGQLRSEWVIGSEYPEKSETFDVAKNEYQRQESDKEGIRDAVDRLLGSEDSENIDGNACRMVFPNGVAIVCPWAIHDSEKTEAESQSIIVGYKKRCGEFQTAEYVFDRQSMKNVNVRYGSE